jgi:hypothetical protein
MAKKIANRSKSSSQVALEPEQRWTVVDAETGRQVYLDSANGIDRPEAERLARALGRPTEVVPRGALDRFGRLDTTLLDQALAAAEAAEE